MKLRLSVAFLLVVVLFGAGCGYFTSGNWEDDPGNWSRAFGSRQPSGVTVLHSRYWRSAHWTYEFQYFFEVAPNTKLKGQLVASKLRQVTGEVAAKAKKNIVGDVPSWFSPKDVAEYEFWMFEESSGGNLMLLIDRKSGVMFLTDYSV
jgi:hypothetical protein